MRSRALGPDFAALVVDARTGTGLLSRRATQPMPPASTLKLLTAAAALTVLGPNAVLTTGVLRAGADVYLTGGGDVTLAATRATAFPGGADLATLAASTAAGLHRSGPVRLWLDLSAWVGPTQAPGWQPDYLRDGDVAPVVPLEVDEGRLSPHRSGRVRAPAWAAGVLFAHDLRRDGVAVAGVAGYRVAARGARRIASAPSAPVRALVAAMLTTSDNDLAEALGRTVAIHVGDRPDFAGAASAVSAALSALGVPEAGLVQVDASGLSRRDRVTAATLVALLRVCLQPGRPVLAAMLRGLPIAGLTGTLADRYRVGEARWGAGTVRAKTGTLTRVSTLAGYLVDADGRLLVFALLSDRAPSATAAESALDLIAARLARCGCRPPP
jgi:D-alanyl-D-alanine carboxypeptidase/D-alanyl-D-alanine-endopeptidase (penicillin-binding protein 4)